MKRRRVKITGIGPVTPAGIGREEFWKGILEPVSRVRPYNKLGEDCGPVAAAYISNIDIGHYVDRALLPKGTARHTIFAIAAAVLALRDAGLSMEEFRSVDGAIVIGASLLDFGGIGGAIDAVQKKGPRAAQPRVVYTTTLTAIPDAINTALAASARTMSVQTSCCSGLDAIGQAAELIASGAADVALCGGTESPLHKFPLLELRAAGLTPFTNEMPERISRPFDQWRTTGVVSEGACAVVLEPDSSPRPGYCFVSGYAFANDEPDDLCGGIAVGAKLAMAAARLRPSQIDAINAWGPGHRAIDAAEVRALRRVFGPLLEGIPTVSIKGALGAALGAAPAIQVASAALGLRSGVLPPTVNWQFPDPACPLNLSNRLRVISHRSTLVNAHGVGNVNANLVLEAC